MLDFYAPLLPEKQAKILQLFYNEDMSLAEIADVAGISRQGVYDALRRGEASLNRYECKLGLADHFRHRTAALARLRDSLVTASQEQLRWLSEIEEEI